MEIRPCSDCGVPKLAEDFSWRHKGVYRMSVCKACMVKRTKSWQDKNRLRYNEYQRAYNHDVRWGLR